MSIGNDYGVFQTSIVLDVVVSSLAGGTKDNGVCLIKYTQASETGTFSHKRFMSRHLLVSR